MTRMQFLGRMGTVLCEQACRRGGGCMAITYVPCCVRRCSKALWLEQWVVQMRGRCWCQPPPLSRPTAPAMGALLRRKLGLHKDSFWWWHPEMPLIEMDTVTY
jgi:hypothetical protein